MEIRGRPISRGIASGEVLVSSTPLSFLGGVDPKTGIVLDRESNAFGRCVKEKVLVFPFGKGSTVGSYVMLQLSKNGVAPAAIVNVRAETIIAVGAIISKIPMIDCLESDPLTILKDGMVVEVDGSSGTLKYSL